MSDSPENLSRSPLGEPTPLPPAIELRELRMLAEKARDTAAEFARHRSLDERSPVYTAYQDAVWALRAACTPAVILALCEAMEEAPPMCPKCLRPCGLDAAGLTLVCSHCRRSTSTLPSHD